MIRIRIDEWIDKLEVSDGEINIFISEEDKESILEELVTILKESE